jgi:3-hydroxybenzoate 6-monooxygenase
MDTSTTAHDPILVVGGGLGGAAVALALARKGFHVRLIEQAPEFGVIGYGIQLGPNAFHMFDRLGVSEAVLSQAIIPNSIVHHAIQAPVHCHSPSRLASNPA